MRSVKRFGTKVATAALAAAMVPVVATGTAQAQAQSGSISYTKATESNKVVETPLNDGRLIVSVWSTKMKTEVPNIVQRPADGNAKAPVLYLVNGAGGGEDSATWQAQSDVKNFMANKNAWTVTPIGGAFSYYTDWAMDWKLIYLVAMTASGAVLAGALGWLLTRALARSGALGAFPPGQEERERRSV